MAKKTSSRRRRASTAAYENGPRAQATAPVQKVDLAEEYRYVIADLERIGIIAAVLIGALVVLSFFL